MDSLEEMDNRKVQPSKTEPEELENMNRPITNTEKYIYIYIYIPKNKSQGPDVFIGKFYKMFSEELTPILLKVF